MKKNLTVVLFLLFLIDRGTAQVIDTGTFSSLKIFPVNVFFKIPAYKVIDTTRLGDSSFLMHRRIKTLDNRRHIWIDVLDCQSDSAKLISLERQIDNYRNAVPYYTGHFKLLDSKVYQINAIKMGLVKHLVKRKKRKFYETKIIFYRNWRMIEIIIEEDYSIVIKQKFSLGDYVSSNLQF